MCQHKVMFALICIILQLSQPLHYLQRASFLPESAMWNLLTWDGVGWTRKKTVKFVICGDICVFLKNESFRGLFTGHVSITITYKMCWKIVSLLAGSQWNWMLMDIPLWHTPKSFTLSWTQKVMKNQEIYKSAGNALWDLHKVLRQGVYMKVFV